MKLKIQKTFYAFALTVCLLTTNSCKNPCDTVALCDIIFQVASLAVPQITVGASLIMNVALKNEVAKCEKTKADMATEVALASQQSTRAQYRADNNSSWTDAQLATNGATPVYTVYANTPSIAAGSSQTSNAAFKFNTPGIYRFALKADANNALQERSKNNNDAVGIDGTLLRSAGSSNGNNSQLTVVVTDPTGKTQPNYDYFKPVVIEYTPQ
jgi:CARDB